MTKSKATPKKRGEDKAMDDVLRRMLGTPPKPITPPSKPKRSRKTVTDGRRQRKK
jgi:hypothetical protein